VSKALIIVDLQNDFMPGGALAVPDGDKIIPLINRICSKFDLVIATRDWHPPNHISFAANHPGGHPGETINIKGREQVLWPVHCVAGTHGAEFYPGFNTSYIDKIINKGVDPEIDNYSCFRDSPQMRNTELLDYLQEHEVNEIYIAGLTTEYCVKFSSLDGVKYGYRTNVIIDACRGVGSAREINKAIDKMTGSGVNIITPGVLYKENSGRQ
jgi:nicotinamidase/pyrazinamidase